MIVQEEANRTKPSSGVAEDARTKCSVRDALQLVCNRIHYFGVITSAREAEHDEQYTLPRIYDALDAVLWKPISLAPTDGTPILGYSPEGVIFVCWHRKGSWVHFENHRRDRWHFNPTHWMDLPEGPREGEIYVGLPTLGDSA